MATEEPHGTNGHAASRANIAGPLTTADELADWYTRLRSVRRLWTPRQLQALDALWNALRDGDIDFASAGTIETMIRAGKTAGARKRLTGARTQARHTPNPMTSTANGATSR